MGDLKLKRFFMRLNALQKSTPEMQHLPHTILMWLAAATS